MTLLRETREQNGKKQETTYTYDAFHRQQKVKTFDGQVQINHYDAEGLRHELEENGKLVRFLYSDREIAAETGTDGATIRYIRGYELISSDSESARTYYHYVSDEQGSITHILGEDEEGSHELYNQYEYGAFGDYHLCEEQITNRFGYTGQQYDTITGQYYLRARYYNPVIGRFTQEDTYYGDGLNLYAYCQNLPIGYDDPTGHAAHAICESKYNRLKEEHKGVDVDSLDPEAKKRYQQEAEIKRYERAKKTHYTN